MVNHATVSMTGFASRRGSTEGWDWAWDIRSVNGKGLDLRLRLPDWIEGLEAAVRAEAAQVIQRGSVTIGLKLARLAGAEGLRVNPAGLAAALAAVAAATETAARQGLELARPSAVEILGLRGVTEQAAEATAEEIAGLLSPLRADLREALAEFDAMRRAEGQALGRVIAGQLDRIAELTDAAAAAAEARRPQVAEQLRENLARVMAGAAEADAGRVAQELALLAVKADVTEEIDRLRAHVAAARGHLAAEGAVGRKLDFLMQEFLREANTLCSKSGSAALTAIGLDLKHVIDQMREQVQNVE